MKARIREITVEYIEETFVAASQGNDVILAFTNHDYKDIDVENSRVRELIKEVSNRHNNISFEYKDALVAMRIVLNIAKEKSFLEASIMYERSPPRLIVKSSKKLFDPHPFLAIKSKEGKYYWDNFDFLAKRYGHILLTIIRLNGTRLKRLVLRPIRLVG